MTRSLPLLALTSVLFVACTTSRPVTEPGPFHPIDEPSLIGAIDEAELQGSAEAAAGARTGRRIGRVAGVIAAVFAGPETETFDEMVDRYRFVRDASEITGALIGAANGASEGAKRGYQMDLQFAELKEIEGLQVSRPFPDEIEVRIAAMPDEQTLTAIASVFAGREARAIDIEAAGEAALDVREALIAMSLPAASLDAHRNDELAGVLLRVHYRT
jgi:hypothetical protein